MKKKIILTIFLVYISILVINNVHALENGFTNPLVMYRIPDNGEEGILSARVIIMSGMITKIRTKLIHPTFTLGYDNSQKHP